MREPPHFVMPAEAAPTACIGVFDSGVGGLSILRALHERLPGTSMIYVGDASRAPYGERTANEVVAYSSEIVAWLSARGAQLIVVACNTATALAIEVLRRRWPELVFVGVEPGIRPAAAQSRTKRIAVMVTAATAASGRLQQLIARYAENLHVHVQPCPGLACAIERGVLDGPGLCAALALCCEEIKAANVDTVVLGCTHYPFVDDAIRDALGAGVTLIDTAAAVAERTVSMWERTPPPFDLAPNVRVISTGDAHTMRRLLKRCPGLEEIEVEALAL